MVHTHSIRPVQKTQKIRKQSKLSTFSHPCDINLHNPKELSENGHAQPVCLKPNHLQKQQKLVQNYKTEGKPVCLAIKNKDAKLNAVNIFWNHI